MSAEIEYLQSVLGVRDLVLPILSDDFEQGRTLPSFEFSFVADIASVAERDLLQKIAQALGVENGQFEVLPVGQMDQALGKTIICLGVRAGSASRLNAVSTYSLSEMLQRPELKREAWNKLKSVQLLKP